MSRAARRWIGEEAAIGRASPGQSKLAEAHVQAVERDAAAATDQRELTEAGYLLLVGSPPREEDLRLYGKTRRAIIDDVDRAVRPDAPEFSGYRERVARTAVQAAAESSWRELVARLENKRPKAHVVERLAGQGLIACRSRSRGLAVCRS